MCFTNFINLFTDEDYTEEFQKFIRNEKNRSGVMISGRSWPFCGKYKINIDCLNDKEINVRNITRTKMLLFKNDIHFCLIWTAQGYSFGKAIEENQSLVLLIRFYFINMLKVLLKMNTNLKNSISINQKSCVWFGDFQ